VSLQLLPDLAREFGYSCYLISIGGFVRCMHAAPPPHHPICFHPFCRSPPICPHCVPRGHVPPPLQPSPPPLSPPPPPTLTPPPPAGTPPRESRLLLVVSALRDGRRACFNLHVHHRLTVWLASLSQLLRRGATLSLPVMCARSPAGCSSRHHHQRQRQRRGQH
jgi:hypothetical protein